MFNVMVMVLFLFVFQVNLTHPFIESLKTLLSTNHVNVTKTIWFNDFYVVQLSSSFSPMGFPFERARRALSQVLAP